MFNWSNARGYKVVSHLMLNKIQEMNYFEKHVIFNNKYSYYLLFKLYRDSGHKV